MLNNSKAFSGIAVDDIETAKTFYGETLGVGIEVLDEENGLISLQHGGEIDTLVYAKPDLQPANYTVLNFPVDDVEADGRFASPSAASSSSATTSSTRTRRGSTATGPRSPGSRIPPATSSRWSRPNSRCASGRGV